MAKKQRQEDARPVEISFADYQHMIDVMDELAFRGPAQEALMMRVAKAGGITEVMERIKRRRIYGKKMQLVRDASADASDGQPRPKRSAPRKPGGARRRNDRKVNPPDSPATETPLLSDDVDTEVA